jgi:hypothetical protein
MNKIFNHLVKYCIQSPTALERYLNTERTLSRTPRALARLP